MSSLKTTDPICQIPLAYGCINNENICPPIFSVSEIGNYCRKQLYSLSAGERDTQMENYCYKYPATEECKCLMRSSNPDYEKLKQSNPYPDSCWYTPCTDPLRYFVSSDLTQDGQCPKNICQIVFDIAKVHNVDINNIQNDINCDFKNGGVIPDPDPKPPNTITISTWVYIVGASMIGIALLIAILK